jgi:hypothetical protein
MAKMTKSEAELLIGLARRQEKVAIEHIKATTAARKAAFEDQIATTAKPAHQSHVHPAMVMVAKRLLAQAQARRETR